MTSFLSTINQLPYFHIARTLPLFYICSIRCSSHFIILVYKSSINYKKTWQIWINIPSNCLLSTNNSVAIKFQTLVKNTRLKKLNHSFKDISVEKSYESLFLCILYIMGSVTKPNTGDRCSPENQVYPWPINKTYVSRHTEQACCLNQGHDVQQSLCTASCSQCIA